MVKVELSIIPKPTEKAFPELTVNKTILEKIYFNSHLLCFDVRDTLGKNAEYLLKNSTVKIQIEEQCDVHGSVEYHLALRGNKKRRRLSILKMCGSLLHGFLPLDMAMKRYLMVDTTKPRGLKTNVKNSSLSNSAQYSLYRHEQG